LEYHDHQRNDVRLVKQASLAPGLQRRVYEVGPSLRPFIHYALDWPDFGVPDAAAFGLLLDTYASDLQAVPSPSPLTHVHCWAGRGRSGTFVYARVLSCLDVGCDPLDDVILQGLRAQRHGLVERRRQEAFAISFRGRAAGQAQLPGGASLGHIRRCRVVNRAGGTWL
jgi:hypothetical protein